MINENSTPLRVGIIGAGMIAQDGHIPAYKQFPKDVIVVAICNRSVERARIVAEKYDIPNYYASADEMFSSCKLDLVSICTSNCTHIEYIYKALDAGVNVLCEKPISLSYEDAVKVYEKAEVKGLMLEACQTIRYNADYIAVRERAVSGTMGKITYGSCNCVRRRGVPMRGAFLNSSQNGGGAMADIGVHFIDALLWMMGSPKVLSVTGMKSANIIHKERNITYSLRESGAYGNASLSAAVDPDLCDVEEFAAGLIRLEGNAAAQFKIAWAANQPPSREICILGDAMGATLPDLKLYGTENGNLADFIPIIPALEEYKDFPFPGHCHLIHNAIAHLKNGEPLMVKPEETLQVTAVLEAFYKSCEENREIFISTL